MDFHARVGVVFVLIGCFLGGMVILDQYGDTLFPMQVMGVSNGTFIDQVFTKAAFQYGPQTWRPGYDPMGMEPGQETPGNGTWYLMFVDTNTTPVTGNPDIRKVGAVRITYNFTGLAGKAVFHVYGLTTSLSMPTRTNRQVGSKRCAWVVTGPAQPGLSMPAASPLAIPTNHRYTVAVSNNQFADYREMTATTREFHFTQPGSGLGALHIAADLSQPLGEVTETQDLNGTFYITATGGDAGSDLLLLLATDRPQPDDFALRIRTEFVRTR